MSLLLKNGEVASSGGVFFKDVLVEDGKIKGVFDQGEYEGDAEIVDCEGKVILPGLIDVHVHFREPGQSYKEDWVTGSKAAAAGGVTTVFDMPNNKPPIFTVKDLEEKRRMIAGRSYVNYGLYIGFNGDNVEEINQAEGIPGVKFYACNSTGDLGVQRGVRDLFEKCNKLIVVHAEDQQMIDEMHEKYTSGKSEEELTPDLHSKIRCREAAEKSVRELCELAYETGHRLHIAHMSTEPELELVNAYRSKGAQLTCEVAPHHLLFSEDDYQYKGSWIRMNPPVRSRADLFALWKGLKFGEIDMVATDHAPHTIEEKEESFHKVPSGVPGVEMMLPILLNAINDEGLSLEEVVKLCCERPAEVFSIKGKGKVEVGYDADLVVVDMDLEKEMKDDYVFSKCAWSPYSGSKFKGWPVKTFVNGRLVFSEGVFEEEKPGCEVEFV